MESMTGYIGLTDPKWYSFLNARDELDEVNFWQPHGKRTFRALKPGEPFFFKLRAPYKAICGFGFFQRYESLPAWLAWEFFETMNGAPDFRAMIDRIIRLRRESISRPFLGEFQIGCIMISAPVFFDEDEWILPPRDWAKTGIQQGKKYDLASGEGKRIFDECMARAAESSRYWNVEEIRQTVAEDAPRYGAPISVRPRLGQGLFSLAVRDAYQGACAVTREHSLPVLEAAHIRPYSVGGAHRVDNGLLLRRDLHRLFDHGYATVTPDYVFKVGERLREEYKNGHSYYVLDETEILLPENSDVQPNKELLDWHSKEVFKG